MRTILKEKKVLKDCKIYQMLVAQSKRPHLSFHTPGHKNARWDITELSYSDNLSCPSGCIADAEQDLARLLGAEKSFLLTDGSTSGVLAMLYAAKKLGVKRIFACEESHKSLFNGVKTLGLELLLYPRFYKDKIPYEPTVYELKEKYGALLECADAVFLTSPDYYGNVADLDGLGAYCKETGKLLLIDGAHGGHLRFQKELHAGVAADLWVDGVHKSLPALTQGAVVSAKNEKTAEALREAVDVFRTTSPSYPIMASVEYAVKYPRNECLEKAVKGYCEQEPRIYKNQDWTKLCATFGRRAFEAEKALQKEGIYPEFCDGNVVMFYLSPATEMRAFTKLTERLKGLFQDYPLDMEEIAQNNTQRVPAPVFFAKDEQEWVDLDCAKGRVCAGNCGLFPPCTPLLRAGDIITEEKLALLQNADNTFGLQEGKIAVLKEKKGE